MKKQVLILTTTHDFLGKFELNNVKILQQMGCEVHYAANMEEPGYLSDEQRLKELGIILHHIDIARSPFLWKENQKALRQVLEILRMYHIEMIHCHTPVGGVLGRLAGHLFREWPVCVIYTAHGFHFYKGAPLQNRIIYYHVEKLLARYTDVLITINEEDCRSACRLHLKRGGSVYKIPGIGLDPERFHPLTKEERISCRKKLGISREDFFLVSVGELNGNKNQEVVLKALEIIRKKEGLGHLIYGICGDGVYREFLERRIREMHLQNHVKMFGFCRNVPEILGCADASVFPSKREGLGMAGLEALAMGIPVLASDNRGTREYMEHGKNGYVCRFDDAGGFAQGIVSIRGMNEQRKKEMAKEAQLCVQPFERKYTTAVMRRIYEEANHEYEEFCENQYCNGSVQSG